MGRPERPLDPAAGPVEGFASQLRELRDQAGRPKYSTMALRAHRSRTGLSEAAGGERLPTWDTTEAFVRACGGDVASWRERWEQAERGAGGSPAQPPPAAPVDETAAPRPWRRTALLMAATAGVVAAATVAILALVRPSPAPRPEVPPSSPSSPARAQGRAAVADGADPKDSGCSLDPNVETLDSMEVDLRGAPVGLIELRYSAACGVAWPRFEPFKLARIPTTAVVHVDVIRPQTHQFRVPFQAKYVGTAVYGNVMHSTEQCVYAAGRVELAGQRAPESRTHCFRGRIPEGAVG